jgi:hypothetical protein
MRNASPAEATSSADESELLKASTRLRGSSLFDKFLKPSFFPSGRISQKMERGLSIWLTSHTLTKKTVSIGGGGKGGGVAPTKSQVGTNKSDGGDVAQTETHFQQKRLQAFLKRLRAFLKRVYEPSKNGNGSVWRTPRPFSNI